MNESPTKYEFTVVRVANGFFVRPGTRAGDYQPPADTYVFRTMADLAAWLVTEELKQ